MLPFKAILTRIEFKAPAFFSKELKFLREYFFELEFSEKKLPVEEKDAMVMSKTITQITKSEYFEYFNLVGISNLLFSRTDL